MSSSGAPSLEPLRDPQLVELIGLEGVGFMVWLVSQASPTPDVPGGWAVALGWREMCKRLHCGPSKLGRKLDALTAAGLIVADQGIRLGRGAGSTPTRYFLTHEPHLSRPDGSYPQGRWGRTDGNFQNGNTQTGSRHLAAVPHDGASALEVPTISAAAVSVQQNRASDGVPAGNVKVPDFLRDALTSIGWVGPPPPGDPALVAAVARNLHTSGRWTNPAGQLNRIAHAGQLEAWAMRENLLTADPTGAQAAWLDTAERAAMMSVTQVTDLRADHPDWYAQVVVEAQRVANQTGERFGMALIRTVALSVPLPAGVDLADYG